MIKLAGTWNKLLTNPIFDHSEDDLWDKYTSAPHILRVGNKFRMYYKRSYCWTGLGRI